MTRECKHTSTTVLESRPRDRFGIKHQWRRRYCTSCGHKFDTVELQMSIFHEWNDLKSRFKTIQSALKGKL
jgi:transcriptional regulator NrdR family protein